MIPAPPSLITRSVFAAAIRNTGIKLRKGYLIFAHKKPMTDRHAVNRFFIPLTILARDAAHLERPGGNEDRFGLKGQPVTRWFRLFRIDTSRNLRFRLCRFLPRLAFQLLFQRGQPLAHGAKSHVIFPGCPAFSPFPEEKPVRQGGVVPRHLCPSRGFDHIPPDAAQQGRYIQSRRFDMFQQGGGKGAVPALAVLRDIARFCGKGDHGANARAHRGKAAPDAGGTGAPHGAGEAAGQRIVATGVDENETGLRGAFHLRQHVVQFDHAKLQIRLIFQFSVNWHQIVLPADLQPVPGIKEQPHIGVTQLAGKLHDSLLEFATLQIGPAQHLKTQPLEDDGQGPGVVFRVGQGRRMLIGRIANDQRNPLLRTS